MGTNFIAITPQIPTFYFEYGQPHRITAWLVEEDDLKRDLNFTKSQRFINEVGCIDNIGNPYNNVLHNPISGMNIEDAWCEYMDEPCHISDFDDCVNWYRNCLSLGMDLSDAIPNESCLKEFYINGFSKEIIRTTLIEFSGKIKEDEFKAINPNLSITPTDSPVPTLKYLYSYKGSQYKSLSEFDIDELEDIYAIICDNREETDNTEKQ